MSPTTIVLIVAILMAVLFLTGKYPYGLITMACCVILCATGVLDLPTAFGGLSNKLVVLIAKYVCTRICLGEDIPYFQS